MVVISVEAFGEKAVERELLRFGNRANDIVPAMMVIAEMFYSNEIRQFTSDGAYASGGWAPLADRTIATKKANPLWANSILERTLDLYLSLTGRSAPDSVYEIEPHGGFIGSSNKIGGIHQHGSPATNLPMRKPVEIPVSTRVDMVKVVQRWIVRGW